MNALRVTSVCAIAYDQCRIIRITMKNGETFQGLLPHPIGSVLGVLNLELEEGWTMVGGRIVTDWEWEEFVRFYIELDDISTISLGQRAKLPPAP